MTIEKNYYEKIVFFPHLIFHLIFHLIQSLYVDVDVDVPPRRGCKSVTLHPLPRGITPPSKALTHPAYTPSAPPAPTGSQAYENGTDKAQG